MRVSVYVPLAMSLVLAAGGPLLARWLAPRTAARVLAGAALITSVSSLWALGLLLLGRLLETHRPALSALVDWAPSWAALIALAAAVGSLTRIVLVACAHRRALGFARAFSRHQQAGEGGLVVVANQRPLAAALRGRDARIVVSSAMLAQLGVRERRALLAHERCHIAHRHDLYRLAGDLACAINPLLTAVRARINQALERWADEDAAASVGSRPLVARTLLQAALAPADAPLGGFGFSSYGVAARVAALQQTPVSSKRSAIIAVSVVALLAAVASADATLAIERLLHVA